MDIKKELRYEILLNDLNQKIKLMNHFNCELIIFEYVKKKMISNINIIENNKKTIENEKNKTDIWNICLIIFLAIIGISLIPLIIGVFCHLYFLYNRVDI